MRTNVRALSGIAIIVGIFASTRPADAGLVQSFPVVIDTVNRVASGSLGSARNTPNDTTQYISCFNDVYGYSSPGYGGGCSAVDGSGQMVSCSLTPGAIVPMSPDSLVAFSWDANGNCTGLQVWTFASTSPKQP